MCNMKNIFILLFISSFLSQIISCSPDNDVELEPLVTLEIHNYDADVWIFATDKSGELLDVKQWQGEPSLSLYGDVSQGERINFFLVFADDKLTNHKTRTVNAYKNILPGRTWQVGKTYEQPPTKSPETSVTLEDIPSEYQGGQVVAQQGVYNTGWASCPTGACQYDMTLYSSLSPDILMTYSHPTADPVYFSTDALETGESYTLDFEGSFKSFDNVLRIPPQDASFAFGEIGGVNGTNFFLNSIDGFHLSGGQVTLGFNDGYSNYYALVQRDIGGVQYEWSVLKPTLSLADFELPDFNFTITNESLMDFSFTNDWGKHIQHRQNNWHYHTRTGDVVTSFQVEVYASDEIGGIDLRNMPVDLVALYPGIGDVDKYEYFRSTFTFNDDEDFGFDEYLEEDFNEPGYPYQMYTYYVVGK